jgi:hypothetical protein
MARNNAHAGFVVAHRRYFSNLNQHLFARLLAASTSENCTLTNGVQQVTLVTIGKNAIWIGTETGCCWLLLFVCTLSIGHESLSGDTKQP